MSVEFARKVKHSISAIRVMDTLEELDFDHEHEKFSVLERKECIENVFYIVSSGWQRELEIEKQLRIYARILQNPKSGAISVECFDSSAKEIVDHLVTGL